MKLIMFSVREDEKPAVKAWEKRNGAEVITVTDPLTLETVDLVEGYSGVCLQQRIDVTDEEIYRKLESFGIKQIALRTAGYDIINLNLAKKYHLKVTNVPAYSPTSVAELVVMQALRLIRNNPIVEDQMNNGDFRWGGMIAKEINTLTVGIIGAGKIGGTAARLFNALGANVIAYDPIVREELKEILTYEQDQQSVLEKADIVSLHVPLNESTTQLIDAEALTQMKSDAYLINAARGPIVDIKALIKALKEKKIAGAALDTLPNEQHFFNFNFKNQSLPDRDLEALMSMNNVLITPHIGFYTTVAVQNMVDISLGSALEILQTEESKNEVY
ncbi:D-2-hydroxyacid dehydrogenase [Marinilactibacillus sp. GCM10026970]|uniref:D-2-hydroxyacid dehydrogenase n=1 Tax=Marinilactibacillus sp. GCM10026970 TaxID=3252642 RepID=UPI003618D4DB